MWLFFESLGTVIFGLGIIVLIGRHYEDNKTFIIALIITFGFLITFWIDFTGGPKTSIETGDYSIVSYAETMSGDKPMYQMILKQNNKIEFYALPKGMVTIDKSNEIPGTLEVIEKAGSKKAIMRL